LGLARLTMSDSGISVDLALEFLRPILCLFATFPPKAIPIGMAAPAWQSDFTDIVLARCAARSLTLAKRDGKCVRFAAADSRLIRAVVDEIYRRGVRMEVATTTLDDVYFPKRLYSRLGHIE